MNKCEHNWFDNVFKNTTICDECGISYNEHIHNEERNKLLKNNLPKKGISIQERFVKMDRDNIEAYTPKYAVDIILPFINKELIIWAPFSRDEHNFADYLRELGYKVINTHFNPETGEGKDFLTYKPDFHYDIIIDNPPFKGKTKFVEKALSYNKPFMLFLPINSLGDNGIPNAFLKYNRDIQLLIPDKRTEFKNQEKKGISFKTAYLCQGILPRQIIFTKLNN